MADLPGTRRGRRGAAERQPLDGVDPDRPFKPINIAVLTVSDTRTAADDTSGDILVERVKATGHKLAARAIETDDAGVIAGRLNS